MHMSQSNFKKKSVWKQILQLDAQLDFHFPILILLLLLFVLRLPNYFEPYWYGDEGIYLTIGIALNHGRELYAQIIDHKTPLIYFLAMVQSQLAFRLLLTGWMLASTTFFYTIAYSFFKHRLSTSIATLVFVLGTTLPWFEGNIPNGELFVMGFILLGGVLLLRTPFASDTRIDTPEVSDKKPAKKTALLFLAGISFGLAILTKVPALFDVVAFASIGLIAVSQYLSFSPRKLRQLRSLLQTVIGQLVMIGLGVVLAILVSILYFTIFGSLRAYLDYGLLYNFRYAGSWGLPFTNPILLFCFTLLGKFGITAGGVVGVLLLKKYLKPTQQFSLIWLLLAVFASLLSNRPYPHYFLQLVPPLALVVGELVHLFEKKRTTIVLKSGFVFGSLSAITLAMVVSVMLLLNVGLYPTVSYYQNWWKLVRGTTNQQDYQNSFNYLMADNYRAAPILSSAKDNTIFIWGTNPMLYALSGTIPAGRFTVAFHIKDFDAYAETMSDIERTQPEYIVVMNDEKYSFPELLQYLRYGYSENTSYEHFAIWRRLSQQSLLY